MLSLSALLCAGTDCLQAEDYRNSIVAETVHQKIEQAELDARLFRKIGLELKQLNRKEQQMLRRKLLEEIVDRALLRDAARGAGFLTDAPSAASPTAREEQEDHAIAQYLERTLFVGVAVTPEDLEQALASGGAPARIPEERQLREIFLEIDPQATEAEAATAVQKAAQLAASAQNEPQRFAEFARRHSSRLDKRHRGSFGFVTANQLNPEIAKAAFSVNEGAVTDPIRTTSGLHIIKVERVRPGYDIPEAEQRETVQTRLLEQKKRDLLKHHLEELRKQNKVIFYLN